MRRVVAHALLTHVSARMRSEGYGSWCLSVTLHLHYRMSKTMYTAYLMGDLGQNICAAFSENAPLQRYGVICVSQQHVRPYLMFMATKASLQVRKANNILNTARNISQWQLKPSSFTSCANSSCACTLDGRMRVCTLVVLLVLSILF